MGSWRPVVMGKNGVIACAHPLASLAGLKTMMKGGNAADALVSVASTLNVVEPYMSGIGGDGIMMITAPGQETPIVLDYCGEAPGGVQPEEMVATHTRSGPRSPLVPGALGGWCAVHERFGTMPLGELLQDAIDLAKNGAPVSHKNAWFIGIAAETIKKNDPTGAAATFLPGGKPPRPGSLLRQPKLAETFRQIAANGPDAYYKGPIGQEIARSVQAAGGYLSTDDLANFSVEWQKPISIDFHGYRIYGTPPPSCAMEYLESLKVLEAEDLTGLGHNSADYLHMLIETIKLSAADRMTYAMQEGFDPYSILAADYIANQRSRIDRSTAALGQGESFGKGEAGAITAGAPSGRNSETTTHFAIADSSGLAINATQSIGSSDTFGSGFMAGETGLILNNFLNWTDLDRNSPNALQPGKKMENCMSPSQAYLDGKFYATLGTPGSWGILQTTPQMILNFLVHGMNIQEAIEAPRIRFMGGKNVVMEGRIPADVRAELERRGHQITVAGEVDKVVGGGQGTVRDPESGVLQGGSDPRRDSYAMAW
jgi:gamma-glutamyltranspeptidase / glutathione hydrolase